MPSIGTLSFWFAAVEADVKRDFRLSLFLDFLFNSLSIPKAKSKAHPTKKSFSDELLEEKFSLFCRPVK